MKGAALRPLSGFVLTVLGWWMWSVTDQPEPIPFPDHGVTYSYDGTTVQGVDLSMICAALAVNRTPILMSVRAIVADPERDQGLFQTDENEEGLFVEYQRSEGYLVRFGLPLEDGSVQRVNVKNHTRDAEFNFVALIDPNGKVRVVTDTKDSETQLNSLPIPQCNDSRIGEAAGLLPFAGTLELSVSTDGSLESFQSQLDNYRDLTNNNGPSYWYQFPLYLGLTLLLFGGVINDLLDRLHRRRLKQS